MKNSRRLSGKRCFVLDMDGTIYLGDQPIQGAVDFVRRHWQDVDFYFLSNNTSKSPESYVRKLAAMGIAADESRILSPVQPLLDFLHREGIDSVYVVGNRDFREDLARRMPGLELDGARPQAVILAYDTELTYEKLAKSALLLRDEKVLFLATHPDLVCPSPAGPVPDVGSLLALYATATGRKPSHIFGKPDPAVLVPLLDSYRPEEMIMVGDRLSTDKKLAENAGIDFMLVLSGEAGRADLAREARQPALVLDHLGQAEEHLAFF